MRHEELSVGRLIGGPKGEVTRFLKTFLAVPAAAVADRYFASAAMHNGAYAVANGGLPGDGLAHNVTCAQTAVDVEDTNGILTIVGKDARGYTISEVLIPDAGVTVQGTKAFAQVTSITGAGWAQGGAGADTIVIGFGDVVGLPDFIPAAADVFLVAMGTALINAPTVTVDAALCKNTITATGADGTKKLRVIYLI
jgi:hypothetical protein